MDKVAECCTTHLIEGDGTFNAEALDTFVKQVKLGQCGVSYSVVAVMGPQSSGKSTLLNHLFHTNFIEMNAAIGRSRTTQGIWIARCPGIEPCTIVMDVEGTDGQERGEDDTAFEKQSALFAIAVSDIVLINMWCHDIGREQAANKPLLKTVFGVMLRLFSPRKRTLMFVIRDKTTKTTLEVLESNLRNDIRKIWDSVPKPQALEATDLSNFFKVEVVAFSSYEDKEEEFNEQVASLRKKFYHSIAPGGLACDRLGVIPASGFSLSTKNIWEEIKDHKDLNLPNLAFMVASIRCEDILREMYSSFVTNKDWVELVDEVNSHLVPGFGTRLSSLFDNCLSNYDKEVIHYDANVGSQKREQLYEKLIQLSQPAYMLMLEHIQYKALDNFKTELNNALNPGRKFATVARDCTKSSVRQFDELCEDATGKQANWDTTVIRNKFSDDLYSHITEVRAARVSELTKLYESIISEAICSPVEALLVDAKDNTWPAIRMHLHRETEKVVSKLSSELSVFELDEVEMKVITSKMMIYARSLVEVKAKDEAKNVLFRMKDRFTFMFNHDADSLPRVWTGNEDIRAIAKNTRSSCLKLLSVMAAIRLDEDVTDTIWDLLAGFLVEPTTDTNIVHDPFSSTTWEKVSDSNTLITPIQCKSLWNQFLTGTDNIITPAIVSQDEAKHSNNTESSGFDPAAYHFGMSVAHVLNIFAQPVKAIVRGVGQTVEAITNTPEGSDAILQAAGSLAARIAFGR